MSKRLLSDTEVEERYGLRGIRQRRRRGTSPPWVKIGFRVFYEPDVVEDWIVQRRRTSTWSTSDRAA